MRSYLLLFAALLLALPASLRAGPLGLHETFVADIASMDFTNADLSGATFDSISIHFTSFAHANLRGASFKRCHFLGVTFDGADVTGADFTNADLTSADLTGIIGLGTANLHKTKLRTLIGVDLAHADLHGASIVQGNLYAANLSKANLTKANLTQADLFQADLRGAKLNMAELTQANLRFADLRGADVTDSTITQADVSGADLRECIGLTQDLVDRMTISAETKFPPGIDVSGRLPAPMTAEQVNKTEDLHATDLHAFAIDGLNFRDREMNGVRLPPSATKVDFQNADLTRCIGPGTRFDDADLDGTTLVHAYLSGADFHTAHYLSTANFAGAMLDQTDFHGVQAEHINLESAYLRGANLSGAKLRWGKLNNTNLQSADLSMADLRDANLGSADLTDAKLNGAQLAGTDLSGTRGLTMAQLKLAATYDADRLPERLSPKKPKNALTPPKPSAISRAFKFPRTAQDIKHFGFVALLLLSPMLLGIFMYRLLRSIIDWQLAQQEPASFNHFANQNPTAAGAGALVLRTSDYRRKRLMAVMLATFIWMSVEGSVGVAIWLFHRRMTGWLWVAGASIPIFFLIPALIRRWRELMSPGLQLMLGGPLRGGRQTELRWTVFGPVTHIERLTLALEGIEQIITGGGEDMSTSRKVLATIPIADVRQFAQIQEGRTTLLISPEVRPSSGTGRHKFLWELKTVMELPGGRNVTDQFEVTVRGVEEPASQRMYELNG